MRACVRWYDQQASQGSKVEARFHDIVWNMDKHHYFWS